MGGALWEPHIWRLPRASPRGKQRRQPRKAAGAAAGAGPATRARFHRAYSAILAQCTSKPVLGNSEVNSKTL